VRALLVIVVAYTFGSIPFGYLIVRATLGADIRQTGSGGTGATNVSRRAGKFAGVLTLILDASKGIGAVWLTKTLLAPDGSINWPVGLAAVAVIVGHIFPVWLKFRGGKGVATAVGVFLLLSPLTLAACGLLFVITVWSTRYVSLGSMVAAASFPFLVLLSDLFLWPVPSLRVLLITSLAIALLIIFAHRGNIARLMQGSENKF